MMGIGPANGQPVPNEGKTGILVEATVPISHEATNQILASLGQAAQQAENSGNAPRGRKIVVLRLQSDADAGGTTTFEDALRIARKMGAPSLRRVKTVVWIDGDIDDDAALLVVAADQILVSPGGGLTSVDHSGDELIRVNYRSLAERRGIIPSPLAEAIADPAIELALVTRTSGGREFSSGESLATLRAAGKVSQEETWASPAQPLRLDADRLRSAQIAAAVVNSVDEAASWLDLAHLAPLDSASSLAAPVGVRLDVTGSIAPNRVRRWLSNLSAISPPTNTYFITFDSPGGSIRSAASLAATFVDPQPPITQTVGVITGSARGDAALAALACDPLYMTNDATLGGLGADSIDADVLSENEELLDLIATRTGRSVGLLRGLLDGSRTVHSYTNRRTGRIAYASKEDIENDQQWRREDWQRGEAIEMAEGIGAQESLAIGLIDGVVESSADAAIQVGMPALPPAAGDRGLVRWIERLGANPMLTFLLLVIGFSALSAEMNAPGLGFPGFVALVCFGMFFWIKFLSGTAEWFELVALTLGLVCIAIELFVVPGVGIFGVGGLALTVLGIVLMSQTFVLPQNEYQLTVLSRSVWTALGGLLSLVLAFVGFRMLLPSVPLFRSLVMESGRADARDQKESLGDYQYLMHQMGTATTPLRPSGKAAFESDIIQVVSDGSMIEKGDRVRVVEVHATRVVVEPVDSE